MARPCKGDMPVILPTEVQPIRVGESLWIAVRGTHYCNDCLALADRFSPKHHVVGSQARRVLAGTLVAQQFLDRRRDQRQVRLEPFELIGMAQQGEYTVANQVSCR